MQSLSLWQHLRLQALCAGLAAPEAAVEGSGERFVPYGTPLFAFVDKSFENLRDAVADGCGWGFLCRANDANDARRGLYLEVSRSMADDAGATKLEFVPVDAFEAARAESLACLASAFSGEDGEKAVQLAIRYLFNSVATLVGLRAGTVKLPVAMPPIDPRLPAMPGPPPELPPFNVTLVDFSASEVAYTKSSISIPLRGAAAGDGAALSQILYTAAIHAISAGAAAALPAEHSSSEAVPAAFEPHSLSLLAAAISDARRTQKVGMAKAPLSLLEQVALAMPDAVCTKHFVELQRRVEWPDLVARAPASAEEDEAEEVAFAPPPTYLAHIADLVRGMVPPAPEAASA